MISSSLKMTAALLLCAAGMTACGSDKGGDEPGGGGGVTVSQSSFEIPMDGGEGSFNVTAPAKWVASANDSWIRLNPTGTGSTQGKVDFTVTKNTTGADREVTLLVRSGEVRANVLVKQYGPIGFDETSFRISGNGGSKTVKVTAPEGWTAVPSESWVKITEAKGETLSFTLEENNGAERKATIDLTSPYNSGSISITQREKLDSNIEAPEGYELVWHDEFETGTTLGSDWTHEVQGPGWVNHELQTYVNGASPSGKRVTEIKDGSLYINCFKENGKVYSGRVYAKVKQGWTYGYIEASIKLPKGKGTWPAFWMMPVNFRSWPADGEIDIMEEVGYNPDRVSSSLHANAHVHSNGTQVTKEMHCPGAEGEYHKYAIEWTKDCITTFVDGKKLLEYKNRGLGRDDWPYDDPFYVILNLAWGGDWGGSQGVDESKLPLSMEVDYVRVFQKL